MTREDLRAALPLNPATVDRFIGPVSSACYEWEINRPLRTAAFLAQIGHETACFKFLRELWGPTPAQERYEGRADLGNTEPGDGRKFCGRGLIQITGRANYAACSLALFNDLRLLERPELLEDTTQAARSAGWFWKTHGLNELADAGNFLRITKIINGGTNGLQQRQQLYQRALARFVPATSAGVANVA